MPPGSASTRYELAPHFAIRMAGVAFDVVAPLATPRALDAARRLGAHAAELDRLAGAALAALRRGRAGTTEARTRPQARLVGMRLPFPSLPAGAPPEVRAYAEARDALERLRAEHARALDEELAEGFRALRRAALRFLPDYALFVSPEVQELADDLSPDGEWKAHVTAGVRARRDRTLLLYVQRVATKNETLSAWGPLSWGEVDPAFRGVRLAPRPGLRREAFFERWVADAIVAAMNADPATRAEVAPRLHPNGRVEDGVLVRLDTGARLPLDADAQALLARCDGRTPAHALGEGPGASLDGRGASGVLLRLAALAEGRAIVWGVESPRFVLDRIGVLRDRVAAWREGEARRRWEPLLAALARIPERFAADPGRAARPRVLAEARELLDAAGAAAPAGAGQRALYRGANVLGEKCARPPALVLGGDVARDLADRVAPWLDVWRDTYAFAAHRANAKLRAIHGALSGRGGAVPLPAFLAACKAAGLPLDGIGIPALGAMAFAEVRAAFREALAGRADARVWTLGPEDAGFLRRRFDFPRFDALTWPSADLQLSATSAEDVAAGRAQWVVAELHYAATLLQHGTSFAAPDGAALAPWLRRASGPLCDWGFPTDILAHTLIDFSPVEELFTYAGADPGLARWRTVRPAGAEVVVADDGDVRLRAGGEERGSFARSWIIGLGFHPFTFPLGAHSPRLETAGVVLQREGWVVGTADLPRAPYARGAPELAIDVDRLRAARGLPRYVYARPTEAAVRRVGAGGRDKDVKPVFLDLESYPFLDVLARWLAKHGELDVTEMLPAPDRLCWREEDGRHTFELRTLFVPAADR